MKKLNSFLHIIGPFPPPYGGVSVHIQRLLPHLKFAKIDYILFDQYFTKDEVRNIVPTNKSKVFWIKYFLKRSPAILHIHQFAFFQFVYGLLYSLLHSAKVMVTIHNENILNTSSWKRTAVVFLIRCSVKCQYIVVSQRLYGFLTSQGLSNVVFMPAYIPPTGFEVKKLDSGLAGPKVFFNAWRLDSVKSNVYGFDLLLQLAKALPRFNIYCFVGDSASADYVKSTVRELCLDNIHAVDGENLVEYLSNADLFLRLNREDAYGVSVKEALDLGVAAIASDVCQRAKGATLFKTGSFESLLEAVSLVENNNFAVDKFEIEQTDFHHQLINLYKDHLGMSK